MKLSVSAVRTHTRMRIQLDGKMTVKMNSLHVAENVKNQKE